MSDDKRIAARSRVLHFIESAGVYGAESVVINLSREMARGGKYEPVIGCIVQRKDEEVDLARVAASLHIEVHRIAIPNRWVLRDLPRAARRIKEMRIDMIHSHGYKPAVFAFIIGMLIRVPVIATCHLWFVEKTAPLKMRFMIGVEKFLYRHFPAVVAVSENIRSILLSIGAEKNRVHLIRNGIALADYEPLTLESVPVKEKIGDLDDGDICILNIARLAQQKAQRDLVSAAALIKATGRRVRILIVGEGELRQDLAQQIENEKVGDVVSLLGFRRDIDKLLQRADIFVLPSLDEGMPISLLEAVAAKVPVIVTAVGDIPKLITHGNTGIIVDAGDPAGLAQAIVSMADDARGRAVLAERALRKLRDSYSSTHMYEMYDGVYSEVLSRA